MAEKQKLTLSVEKELVEKAKKLGVNISEITEIVLKHVSETETKDVVTKEEINAAYKKLFNAMLPAMKKFGASVEVGKFWLDEYHSLTVKLFSDGELWVADVGTSPKFEDVSFDPPKKILSTFIDSLIAASERNKEKLKELEIFRRIIEALTETTASRRKDVGV